jgi:hypothetical protein
VDRLTTGRRYVRAGSVTVTELLSRQASQTHCTDSSPATLDDDVTDDVTDTIPVVLAANPHRRAPARGAQLAKLASLGVAGVVLCGAVAVSSLVTQRRDANQSAARPTVQITGEQALLPDKLDETLPTIPDPATSPAQHHAGAPEETSAGHPAPSTATSATRTDSGTTASAGTVKIAPASDMELVREFYRHLPDAPAAAFDLLSADSVGTNLRDFLFSWSRVISINSVDVAQRADGVLAIVRMRMLGGGQLRVEQLLTVAESPRRIVGVQLLSAQRN